MIDLKAKGKHSPNNKIAFKDRWRWLQFRLKNYQEIKKLHVLYLNVREDIIYQNFFLVLKFVLRSFVWKCLFFFFTFFMNRKLETGTLANSDDPDELQHCGALHLGMHCLLNLKQPSGTDIYHIC